MFHSINIPFGAVMMFNVVDLKDGVTIEDVELALGEMCNVVKNNYGDDKGGFIAGQVYKNSGFVSAEGSVSPDNDAPSGAEKIKAGKSPSSPSGRVSISTKNPMPTNCSKKNSTSSPPSATKPMNWAIKCSGRASPLKIIKVGLGATLWCRFRGNAGDFIPLFNCAIAYAI